MEEFASAGIDHGDELPGFLAGQYSFFGNLDGAEGLQGLEGGLEDGVDAPPEEDGLPPEYAELEMEAFEDLDLAATDDLSLATMINNIGLDDGPSASDLRIEDMQPTASLHPTAPVIVPRIPSGTAIGSHRSSPAVSLGKSPGPLAGYTPLQHPSLSTAQTAMQQPQQLYLDPVSIMQPVPHQRQQQHMMMQSQTPQAQQQHGVFGIPHQHVAPRVASTEEIEVQVPRQAYNRQASVQAYHSMAPAPGTLPSPTMLGGQQQQPQPGRPPLVPWTGADASAGVLPPPPPPQRVRSQSPVARQSPPARQLLPPAGTHKVHSGGFGSGFGAVNRDHQGHSQAHQHQHHGHRHFRSKYMSDEDIRHILRIQWAAVHSGNPYHEDYYYQAFLAKHVNGANAAAFAPDTLRVTAPQERAGQDATTWVPVEGLGKIAMSNIRRPKPLMELAPDQRTDPKEEEVNESLERMAPTRPLEQEPLLAARIMVEDCMSLLLDVDDIERMFRRSMVTGLQVEDAESLMHRRTVLMEGLAASLRLPGVQFTSSGASELNDGVFLRLMTLPKGRRLLGQALRRLFSAFEPASANSVLSSPQLRILNAVMRNLRMLFGFLPPEDSVVAQAKVSKEAAAGIARQSRAAAMETTATIAAAGVEAIHRLGSCQACINSLQAAVGGDLASRMGHGGGGAATALLPLAGPPGLQPAEFSSPWLGDLLAALLERASVLGLGRAASVQPAEQQARDDQAMWEEAFAKLMGLVMSHVAVVLQVFRTAKAQGIVEGMQYARSVIPVKVVRAIILHCSETQRNELRSSLSELG